MAFHCNVVKPRHTCIVERINRVIVSIRIWLAQLPVFVLPIEREVHIPFAKALVDLLGIHVVAFGLI